MNLLNWFKNLGREKGSPAPLSDDAVLDLIRYLENCDEGCDEAFRVLDQYAEIEIRKEDAARLLPVVHEHLETCTHCCDAYEALLDVLAKANPLPETEEGQSP